MYSFHDAHCHLTQFEHIDSTISEALAKNVSTIIAVSMFLEENEKVFDISEKYPENILPAFGIHPLAITDKSDIDTIFNSVNEIIQLNINKIRIIGEIGLDKYFTKDSAIWAKQSEIFAKFLELAEKHRLAITVHGKNAEEELLSVLENYKIEPVILHWYSTTKNTIKRAIDNGFFFSVNLSIRYSKQVQELVELSPIDRLLTESDGPVPYKPLNLIGSPGLIPQIVSEIAKIKQLTERDTAVQLDKNLKTILKTNH